MANERRERHVTPAKRKLVFGLTIVCETCRGKAVKNGQICGACEGTGIRFLDSKD